MPRFLLVFYSKKFLQSQVAQELPISRKKRGKTSKKLSGQHMTKISQLDVEAMYSEVANHAKQKNVSNWRILGLANLVCQRNRRMRMKNKALERFEAHLDIIYLLLTTYQQGYNGNCGNSLASTSNGIQHWAT